MKTFAGRTAAALAALGALIAASAPAAAAEPQGLYLRGDVGASLGRTIGGSVLAGDGFAGDIGNSALFEAGVGYQLPYNLRADLTVGYRPGFKVESREARGTLPVNADADVKNWAVMANLYYDIATGTAFTPYVGAGLGVAFNKVDDVTYSFGAGRIHENGKSKTNFAWSLQAGAAYAVTQNVKVDLGYRYIDLGGFETGGSSTVGAVAKSEGDVRAHEVKIALRYAF